MFFINDAMAAPAGTPQGAGYETLIMLVVFGLIFYFLMIRPQTKRAKEHKKMIEALEKGDEVVSNGGILGKVLKVTDNFVVIAIADGVEINLQKHAVAATLPKGTIKSIKE